MKYDPTWCWNHPDARDYWDNWAKKYPNATPTELAVQWVADHDPFIQLLSPDKEQV